MTDHRPMTLTLLHINCPSVESADAITEALLSQHFIAAANRYPPIRSTYRWQGAIHRAEEHPLVLKTRADLVPQVEDAIRALHPYDVPAILRIDVDGANAAYIEWLNEVTRAP